MLILMHCPDCNHEAPPSITNDFNPAHQAKVFMLVCRNCGVILGGSVVPLPARTQEVEQRKAA